jgi:hypothetical protein
MHCWNATKLSDGHYVVELRGMAKLHNEGGVFSRTSRCKQYKARILFSESSVESGFLDAEKRSKLPIFFGFRAKGHVKVIDRPSEYHIELMLEGVDFVEPMSEKDTDAYMREFHI